MPFAGYKSFEECVRDNQDKTYPEAFCAYLHYQATGKYPAQNQQFPSAFPFDSVTECIERMSEEDIDEPGAFCAAWYHDTYGRWPAENRDGMAQALVTHMATTEFNRYATFEGRNYLVAPVVALVEGVVNGELVPGEEIGKYVDAWNGIPLPIDHPRRNGRPVSANDPARIEQSSLGRFFNARVTNGRGKRLRGELWIDIEKANRLGGEALEVLQRLENGEPLEVSTAYFRDLEAQPGSYGDKDYIGIQRNLRPDHLALLPQSVGACSWEDGAGAPRVNDSQKEGGTKSVIEAIKGLLMKFPWLNQGKGFRETEQLLERALTASYGDASRFFIEEVFEDYLIYRELPREDGPGVPQEDRLYRLEYEVNEDGEVVFGERQEVRREVSYEPVETPTAQSSKEGSEAELANKEKVEALITNARTKWTEDDREKLMAMDEEILDKMEPEEPEEETTTEETEEAEEEEKEGGEETTTEQQQPQTFEEWVETIPDPELREEMKANRKRVQERRAQLVEGLAKNERCQFDKEELNAMTTPQLEKLERSVKPEDYSGKGGPRGHSSGEDEDAIPEPPPVILQKKTAGGER